MVSHKHVHINIRPLHVYGKPATGNIESYLIVRSVHWIHCLVCWYFHMECLNIVAILVDCVNVIRNSIRHNVSRYDLNSLSHLCIRRKKMLYRNDFNEACQKTFVGLILFFLFSLYMLLKSKVFNACNQIGSNEINIDTSEYPRFNKASLVQC